MKKFIVFVIFFNAIFVFAQNIDTAKSFSGTDTVVLRVTKYQFNDYFSVDTLGIDTVQKNIEIYDKYTKNFIPVINLGQIATPSVSVIYKDRSNFNEFNFLTPYNDFLLNPQKSYYYKNNNPYTDFSYFYGPKAKEEQNLKVVHSQTFNDSVNVGVRFYMKAAINLQGSQENSSINNLSVWYRRQFKNYNLYASIYSNKVKRIENGGIVDTNSNFDPTSPLQFYISNQVANVLTYRGYYLNQSYNLSKNTTLRHIFQYSRIGRTFIEEKPNSLFGNTQLSDVQTHDSTGIRSFDNTFNIDINNKFGLAYTNKIRSFYYFKGYFYNLNGVFDTDNFLSIYANNYKFGNFNLSSLFQMHFTGRNTGNIDLKSNLKYHFTDSVFIAVNQSFKQQSPDYFYEHYNGNYQSWENNFSNLTTLSFSAKFIALKPHFEIGAAYNLINNYIYFDSLISPQQILTPINIQTLWVKKSFYISHFVVDFGGYWQTTNNIELLNIPEYVATGSFYFDFSLAKDALHLNVGVNSYYTSKFFAYAYSPTIGNFYQSNKIETGNYPMADIFLTARIKSAYILVRFDHANAWLLRSYYETTEHYHLYYRYLRFGVRWWFKN